MEIPRKEVLLRKDFVTIRNKCTLSDAIMRIQQKKITNNRSPVTLYKNALSSEQNKDIDVETYVKTCDSYKIFSQKFEIVNKGIQQLILTDEIATKNHLKLSNEYFLCDSKMDDETYAVKLFNKYFKLSMDPNFSTVYLQNNTFGPNKQTYLKFDKSVLLNGEPTPGLNIPSWDVSCSGSVIPFRDCHRNIPYINLLLQGDSRVYAFVPSPFVKHFVMKLQSYIKSDCPFKLFHNSGCMINFELLLKWNIPIQFCVQEPGDLIFINGGVLFCAINNGLNLSESICFCDEIYFNKSFSINCKCENEETIPVKIILKKFEEKQSNKSIKKIYQCKIKNCVEGIAIYNKKTFNEHCIKVHALKLFRCKNQNCSKRFTRKHDARRHFEYYHKKNYSMMKKYSEKSILTRKVKIPCQICDKPICRKNLRRHLALTHMMKDNRKLLDQNVKEHYKIAMTISSKGLKLEMGNVRTQVVNINLRGKSKKTIHNETAILHSKLSKTRKLCNNLSKDKENGIIEIEKLRKKLQKLEQQKNHDTLCMDLELQKSKQIINQVITDRDKKLAEFENLQEEFQRQENLKNCQILELQLKLDNAEKMIYEITMDRDKRLNQINELQEELQQTKTNIEKIHSETAAKQIQFCESLHLQAKSPNLRNRTDIKCHNYALRNRLYM